jgi:hypothetical protein
MWGADRINNILLVLNGLGQAAHSASYEQRLQAVLFSLGVCCFKMSGVCTHR